MIVHTFMIELDQLVYLYPRKYKRCVKICIQRHWRILLSCGKLVSQIKVELPSKEGDIEIQTKLCKDIIPKWIIQIYTHFYCCVSKVTFQSPNPQCCFGKLQLNDRTS